MFKLQDFNAVADRSPTKDHSQRNSTSDWRSLIAMSKQACRLVTDSNQISSQINIWASQG